MTEQPTLPDRETLRAEFYAAVREIGKNREQQSLTNDFYTDTAESVFAAGYEALQEYFAALEAEEDELQPHLQVVSAPAGGGKTTFAKAMMVALVRVTERMPHGPLGCVFIADQIERAHDTYRELAALLPSRVAIWTSDHDRRAKPSHEMKVQVETADRFLATDLERYPVIVATHAFYKGSRGRLAKKYVHEGYARPRALTVVDERPNETEVFDVALWQAFEVHDFISKDVNAEDDVLTHIEALVCFMADRHNNCRVNLEKPSDAEEAWTTALDDLQWFRTSAADHYANKHRTEVSAIVPVFGYARSLAEGYSFIARDRTARFVGYRQDLVLTHGMLLLDATADIDGMQQVCPWRRLRETPRARYDNLSIICVPRFTTQRLSTFFTKPSQRKDYVRWMREVVTEHMQPGQKGLVICKKILFDEECIFARNEKRGEPSFYIDWGGRKIAATHWGRGIGSNEWQDADAVFLFDEFHLPRRAVIAETQALQGHKATEGALSTMKTQNSKAPKVDALSDGHLLRWQKQMALRGNARKFDAQGVCGKQKLIYCGALERLLASMPVLYPGAKVTFSNPQGTMGERRLHKLLAILSAPKAPDVISTETVAKQFGKPWKHIRDILRPKAVKSMLASLGWKFVTKRGAKGASWFERIVPAVTQQAA